MGSFWDHMVNQHSYRLSPFTVRCASLIGRVKHVHCPSEFTSQFFEFMVVQHS